MKIGIKTTITTRTENQKFQTRPENLNNFKGRSASSGELRNTSRGNIARMLSNWFEAEKLFCTHRPAPNIRLAKLGQTVQSNSNAPAPCPNFAKRCVGCKAISFLTLTFPQTSTHSDLERKRILSAFLTFCNRHGLSHYFYISEATTVQGLHFHCIVRNLPASASDKWQSLTDGRETDFRKQEITDHQRLTQYLTKGKNTRKITGRLWGASRTVKAFGDIILRPSSPNTNATEHTHAQILSLLESRKVVYSQTYTYTIWKTPENIENTLKTHYFKILTAQIQTPQHQGQEQEQKPFEAEPSILNPQSNKLFGGQGGEIPPPIAEPIVDEIPYKFYAHAKINYLATSQKNTLPPCQMKFSLMLVTALSFFSAFCSSLLSFFLLQSCCGISSSYFTQFLNLKYQGVKVPNKHHYKAYRATNSPTECSTKCKDMNTQNGNQHEVNTCPNPCQLCSSNPPNISCS